MSTIKPIALIIFLAILATIGAPDELAQARGLVPCGGLGESACTPCDIFLLVQNILNFLWWYLTVPLATLMLIYGGFLMIVPGFGGEKSATALTKGKKVITNALIGIVIIFFAWLAIDTILKVLVDPGQLGSGKAVEIGKVGPWNEIKCTSPSIQEIERPF